MKKVFLLAALLILSLGLASCAAQTTVSPAAELLGLGEQYLLDLDYEQALVQFLGAIEVEPMNPRGYTGAAEAYMGLGDVDSAVDILEEGLDLTGDEALDEMIERLLMEWELLSPDWDIEALLEEVYGLFEAGRDEEAMETFGALGEDIYLYDLFDENVPTLYLSPQGRGVGVYYIEGDGVRAPFYFFYYGGYDGEQRSGQGFWSSLLLTSNASEETILFFCHRFQGEWANDAPNGYGEVRVMPTLWDNVGEYGFRGNMLDGYLDGEASFFSRHVGEDADEISDNEIYENGYQVSEISGYHPARLGVPGFSEDWNR